MEKDFVQVQEVKEYGKCLSGIKLLTPVSVSFSTAVLCGNRGYRIFFFEVSSKPDEKVTFKSTVKPLYFLHFSLLRTAGG